MATKEFIKSSVGLLIAVPIAGAAIGMLGAVGIMGVTGTLVGAGLLKHTAKTFKLMK